MPTLLCNHLRFAVALIITWKYLQVEERRVKATRDQVDKWAWQKKQYNKGEDPIDEWRKRRESGQISDLENQYGDPKEVGGIPLPMASFGVGGEFGVGGKFDNGGRFDLRLPYAEQVSLMMLFIMQERTCSNSNHKCLSHTKGLG